MAKIVSNYVSLDQATGEYYRQVLLPVSGTVELPWVKVYEGKAQQVAIGEGAPLHGQSYRVLWYLAGGVEWHNQIPGTAATAAALGIQRAAAVRAFGELVGAGYILKHGTRYHLSPALGWKGSRSELRAFYREVAEA